MKDVSHAKNLIIRIPFSISFIPFVLWSLNFITSLCKFPIYLDILALRGMSKAMTATPERAGHPNNLHNKNKDPKIWKGEDHIMCKKGINSWNFWASMDCKLTIAPMLDVCRALFDRSNDFLYTMFVVAVRTWNIQ